MSELLSYPAKLKAARLSYKLSAASMSFIMGFGPNTWSHYEKGGEPNESHKRLADMSFDPKSFTRLMDLCPEWYRTEIGPTKWDRAYNEALKIDKYFDQLLTLEREKLVEAYFLDKII